METEAEATPSGSSSPAAYPCWVMLARNDGDDDEYSRFAGDNDTGHSRFTGDAKIAMACFTSEGLPIRVSLSIAAPPTKSRLRVHCPAGGISARPNIIAAHGDSLLIQIYFSRRWAADPHRTVGTFVYSAGNSSRPPSLRLLPSCYFVDKTIGRSSEDRRGFFMEVRRGHSDTPRLLHQYNATGLLRRGRDALVVAELKMAQSQLNKPAAELLVLRSGKWSVTRAPISHASDKCRELPSWNTETVVPVGDRLLCWVDLNLGLLFSDVFHDKPELRYMSLPATPRYSSSSTLRNVCATADGVVKFVNIFHTHRCGCSGGSATKCPYSCYACIVETWTLRMDDMVWVMDATVDATELYALDAWKGVPRVQLECPVVSIEDPMVICFVVCRARKQWMIMVDTRSRTVQAVSRGPELGDMHCCPQTAIPSRFSYYLNSFP